MRVTYSACPHEPKCEYGHKGECITRQAKDRKRVKTVVHTGEVPHLWFHKVQPRAKNAGGNLYFEGDTIFSYGSHFPIARHVSSGKKNAVLFTEKGYSITTSGHKSAVRSSLPEGTTVFHVEEVIIDGWNKSTAHKTNLASFIDRVARHLVTAARARVSYTKEYEHGAAVKLREEAREYAKFFKLPLPKIAPIPKLNGAGLAKIKAQEAKKSAEKAVAEKLRKAELAKQEAELVAKWRAGEEGYRRFYNSPVALRVTKDRTELETSLGVRIPIDHALRVLQMVRKVKERGEPFVTNGHSIFAGPYKVERIDANGDLKAGCHFILNAEIELVAPQVEQAAQEQAASNTPQA